eukprot:GHVP01054379.1.p1 GENE.GHVP01054379.1~~GHVP01054379.1.p1  ORF type:complete len:261 (+),score=50.58 GHVP01054379.1:170-952(+)
MTVDETPQSQNEDYLRKLYGFGSHSLTSSPSASQSAELASVSSRELELASSSSPSAVQSEERSRKVDGNSTKASSWKIEVQEPRSRHIHLTQYSDTIPTLADYRIKESESPEKANSQANFKQNSQEIHQPKPRAKPFTTNLPYPSFPIHQPKYKPLQKVYTHPTTNYSSGSSYPVWPRAVIQKSDPVFYLEQQQQEIPQEIERIADLTDQLVDMYQNSASPEEIQKLHLHLCLSHQRCIEPCPRPPEVYSILSLHYESNE